MAWTTPRTWTTGEVVTAAIMNAHVRDNLNFLYGAHGARVYNSVGQNVASSTSDSAYTALSFDSEARDTDAFHSTVSNQARLTIPTGLDGDYLVGGTVEFAAGGGGVRRTALIEKNGTTIRAVCTPGGATVGGSVAVRVGIVSYEDSVAATDFFRLGANQDSGGGINAQLGNNSTFFWLTRIGT